MPLSIVRAGFILLLVLLVACSDANTELPVEPNRANRCEANDLQDRSDRLLQALIDGKTVVLDEQFGLPQEVFQYMVAERPNGLSASLIFESGAKSTVLDGEYEAGKLVIFADEANIKKLTDPAFLQEKKFSSFVVCHFICDIDQQWRLSSNTCFEETGDPFHGDY